MEQPTLQGVVWQESAGTEVALPEHPERGARPLRGLPFIDVMEAMEKAAETLGLSGFIDRGIRINGHTTATLGDARGML